MRPSSGRLRIGPYKVMQTKIIKVNPNFPEENLIKEAAAVLQKGGLVAFPTETVYGIAANFLNQEAIDRLYRIKKRPRNKPFTFHIAKFDALKDLEIDLEERAKRVVHKFWPGPLSIVALNKKRQKIGIRMPRNKVALTLIEEASIPLVAPSANITGGSPPTSGEKVISEMKGSLDVILDGGTTEIGMASTVLDVTAHPFAILRQGALSKEDLLADYHVLFICTGNSCRSVMAKAILEKLLGESGLSEKVRVDSAGTIAYSGIAAAPNTVQVLEQKGMNVSMHKSKTITLDLLRKSDFIFVMECTHKDIISRKFPEFSSKVKLLKENEDIPDPIGKSLEEYECVRNIINNQVENIFLELFKQTK